MRIENGQATPDDTDVCRRCLRAGTDLCRIGDALGELVENGLEVEVRACPDLWLRPFGFIDDPEA